MEQKHPIAWHVPNLINICIDSVEDGEMTGKIYHCYSEEAIAFSNIIRMIETVEEFFDCLQFPQAATQTRSFHRKESVQGQKLEKKLEQEQILQMRGQKGTFLLNVKYRQNSSWQGSVTWVDEQREQYFRSALELLKLIDGALVTKNDSEDICSDKR